ncbi:hypothetical protein GXW78_27265 [Roseomonas terrae]|uniref:Uncharacterized protein n=1 Tax=Neoroseomonas terrae TaxID=424799 RepID=A0ABS5EQS2_9PROT|nr:hypothetical protein [Neoroseomonas terrae]MBR0653380.1 hypothetical protein [Neoroseomonas terrae]
MNAVTITAAGLRAALAGLRDRAADPDREQPADYLTGGIDLLVALLPEEDAPALPPSILDGTRAIIAPDADHTTTIVSLGERTVVTSGPRTTPASSIAEQVAAAFATKAAEDDADPDPPVPVLGRWALPDGGYACATLDDLLPDGPDFTPRQVVNLEDGKLLWVVRHGEANVADHEWVSCGTEADAAAYCTIFRPSADTTAEPTASLASAPAEEAPPTPESATPSPPPAAATAEGATLIEAGPDNAPGDAPAAELLPKSLADAAARSAPAASSSATDERLSLLRTLWVDPSCSVSEIFRRWNALPGKPLVTSNALYGHAKKLGLSTQRPVTMPTRSTDAPAVAPPQAEPRMKQAWRKPETPLPAPNAAEASRSFDPKSLDPEDNGLKESREVTTARGLLGEGYDESYVARLSRLARWLDRRDDTHGR